MISKQVGIQLLVVGAVATAAMHVDTRAILAAPPSSVANRVIHCSVGDDQFPAVVTGVAITPDGETIAAATDDHHVSLWCAATGELKQRFDTHGDWVLSVGMSSDGKILATGAGDRTVCLWNLEDGRRMFQLPACDSAIAAVSFHPNCQQLAVVGFCNSMQIVDIASGQSTERHECPCADLRAVSFAPNGERMAVAGRNGPLRIWNMVENQPERDIEIDGRPIRTMDFSPDGRLLASAGDGPLMRISDVATGGVVMTLSVRPSKAYAVKFIDNQQVAVGGSDNCIRIWNLETGTVTRELLGHTGTVASLAVDLESKTLVSGSYDTTVRIWRLNEVEAPTTAALGEPETTR